MKDEIPRRTLDELVARYTFEPSLRDVFVEGSFDSRVFNWLLDDLSANSISVYEIDTVDCPLDQLTELGLPEGSRSRVIWLAICLTRLLGQDINCVYCIADSDHEVMGPPRFSCSALHYTDLTSLEAYFFCDEVLSKPLHVAIGLKLSSASAIIAMRKVLSRLFAIRCTNLELGWGMKWLEPWKSLEAAGESIEFDETDFIAKYLNKNARAGFAKEFSAKLRDIQSRASGSQPVRGHDAFDMLAWWLRKAGVRGEFCDANVLLAFALSATQSEFLYGFPLFEDFRSWVAQARSVLSGPSS